MLNAIEFIVNSELGGLPCVTFIANAHPSQLEDMVNSLPSEDVQFVGVHEVTQYEQITSLIAKLTS